MPLGAYLQNSVVEVIPPSSDQRGAEKTEPCDDGYFSFDNPNAAIDMDQQTPAKEKALTPWPCVVEWRVSQRRGQSGVEWTSVGSVEGAYRQDMAVDHLVEGAQVRFRKNRPGRPYDTYAIVSIAPVPPAFVGQPGSISFELQEVSSVG